MTTNQLSREEPNYEADITIDPDELAAELIDQALRYFRYSELYAQSVLDRDRAKESFSQVQAQLDSEIRNDPASYGIPKVTEAAIKSAILLDAKYSAANEEMQQASLVCNTLQGAVTAFDHRKRMLEKICDLKIAGLYSDPTVRKEVKTITEDALTDQQLARLNREKPASASPIRRLKRE
jgi:hypothetical protein